MYEAYYGFEEKPFALSPDPKYLFLSASHREVLGHLLYGVEQGEGFMAISGEVGTGKTTLCRTLLDRLGSSCEIAFLFNPMLSPTDLIKAINGELGLSTFGDSRPELIDVLNTFLLEQNALGRRVLVIIDEAQNLPTETLEQLRLLSNLESHTSKLLQIVLIGQPELDHTLETRELRQLRQRITVWWRLGPLAPGETREYVQHRLRIAGAERPIFTDAALSRVQRLSGGVPRLVNVLCDRALLAGFAEHRAEITARIVRDVAREIRLTRGAGGSRLPWILTAGGAAIAGLAALAFFELPPAANAPDAAPPPVAAPAPAAAADALAAAPSVLPTGPSRAELEGAAEAGADAPATPSAPLLDDPLDNLLRMRSAGASDARALDALLEAWQLPPRAAPELSFSELLAALEENGLRVIRIRSQDELEQLDVPGLVELQAPDGNLHAALIRHIDAGTAQLDGVVPGQLVSVPLGQLNERWKGEGYAAWRDYEGLPPVLRSGASGQPVAFLQRALARLGHYHGEVHGSFDDATEQAVRSFQRSVGLVADGSVGPLTQVQLYHALPDYRMPLLAFTAETAAGR